MEITQMLLTPNQYSRPCTKLRKVVGVAIHWVGNAGSSAKGNRNYFEDLKLGKRDENGNLIYGSSHYMIGLNGEIIQCIPEDEIAYCTNARNVDTISIECCHPDWEGKFNDATYNSLVELCRDILKRYNATEVIRHYDVTGKECPRYYVRHEDAWLQLKEDILKKEEEEDMANRYETLDQIPDYAKPTIQKLLNKGFLTGTPSGLHLTDDMIRMFCVNDRAKLYDEVCLSKTCTCGGSCD